jgi:hypothetical protein
MAGYPPHCLYLFLGYLVDRGRNSTTSLFTFCLAILSQISEVSWIIRDEFCSRIIVIDGLIQWVLMIRQFYFIGNRVWLPSRIKIIFWKVFLKLNPFNQL